MPQPLARARKLLSFGLLSLSLLAPSALAMEITLATGVNSDPPYVYGDIEIAEENPGITIDILRLVEKKTGHTFEISKRPWARVVHDVKTNHLDGGFHFSYKEKRKAFIAYPIVEGQEEPNPSFSISNRSYMLYRLKNGSVHWDGERIKNTYGTPFAIAVIRGSSIVSALIQPDYALTEVETDEQMIELLLAGRVDGFVGIDNMIDPKINTLNNQKKELIEKASPAIQNKPYYVAFSREFYNQHPEVAWQVWEAIDEIKKNGELIKLFEHYAIVNKQQELQALEAEIQFLKKYREIQDQVDHTEQTTP